MKKLIVALIAFSFLIACEKEKIVLPGEEPVGNFVTAKFLNIENSTVLNNQQVTVIVEYNIMQDELELKGFEINNLFKRDGDENYTVHTRKQLTSRSGKYEYAFEISDLYIDSGKPFKYIVVLYRKTDENTYTRIAESEEYDFSVRGN